MPLEIDGVAVRTLPLMAAPTVNECRFPVDVVYTWVDGDDPEWDAAREARISGMEGTAQTREASGRARFISRDELRYSLRSVHLFAPWVRNIYVVTSGQVPAWLDARPPRRDGRAARRDHAGRRAADVQLARDRDLAAPHPRAGRALALLQRRLLPRPAAAARGAVQPGRAVVGVLRAEHRSGSRTCPTRRRGSRPRGTTAACCSTPSARSRPTRWPTRRTPSAPRCCARSSSGSPTWSARRRGRRSGPTPTSRR